MAWRAACSSSRLVLEYLKSSTPSSKGSKALARPEVPHRIDHPLQVCRLAEDSAAPASTALASSSLSR